jgi:hypothetical protein
MYIRILKKYEKALGIKYILILVIVNNLGFLYANRGKRDEVKGMYIRALKGYKKVKRGFTVLKSRRRITIMRNVSLH